jgi:hypothetical protein
VGGRRERESVSLFIWLGVGAKDTKQGEQVRFGAKSGNIFQVTWRWKVGRAFTKSWGPNFHWESGKGRRGCIWPPTNVVMATT